jgi:D-alanyl-D-alanine carboxypeptidase
MRTWAWLLGLAVLAQGAASAQPIPAHAFTSDMAARIDRLGDAEVRNGRTPGIAIGVVVDGRVVYARGFGYANVARHIPATPDTQFYIGEVSEEFTAGAVLMLVQDGKIKLDDRVTKYLPELSNAGNITVAELLSQTSGLPDIGTIAGISSDPTKQVKINDLLAAVAKMQLAATPGTTYSSNRLNYILAGLIVERVSAVTLSDFLGQRIFIPLVMNQTLFAGDTGIDPSHAIGYSYNRASQKFLPATPWDPSRLLGSAGVVSTIYDLAKWDIEMPILLRVDAVRDMFTAAGGDALTKYGMGWVVDRRGGKTFVWSDGQISGYRAMNALLPDEHVAVIVLTNSDAFHGPSTSPELTAARILDIVAPPSTVKLDNSIVERAREWLVRLANKHIDRTELSPAFSAFLTDDLIARENFAQYGNVETIVPVSSTTESNGDTLYEFVVQYPHDAFHYKFAVTSDGKVDEILLSP